jgi:DNA-binding transcriptional ArsR family regulator
MAKFIREQSPDKINMIFQALADPTRRNILERLSKQTLTVTEIARPYGFALPTISKHLNVLQRADLIRKTKLGREYHVYFQPKTMRTVEAYVSFYRKFWTVQLGKLEALLANQPLHHAAAKRGGEEK